jgi:hypothetical protein
MLLVLKVQYGTAIDLEGSKDKVRIIVSNRAMWREVKDTSFSLFISVYKLILIF